MSSYSLPLLPSIPDDLENIDTRHALPHLMALMKNTLIRGLNRIHACAPLITTHHPALPPFLDYVRSLLMHLNVHLEEDATFFSTSALAEIVTSETNPDTEAIRESIASLLSLVSDWIKDESTYCSSILRDGLSFGTSLVAVMQVQIKMLTPALLSSIISHSDLLELITGAKVFSRVPKRPTTEATTGSVGRSSERSDMTFLLPFVLSHHDHATSTYWPNIHKDGIAMLPTLILGHPGCWQFAPFNPLTREIQSLSAISA